MGSTGRVNSKSVSVVSLMKSESVISSDPKSVRNVETLIQDFLSAMAIGEHLDSRHDNDAETRGEYTEYEFTKQGDNSFAVKRYERVWTGATRTGFEVNEYDEGIWRAKDVGRQIKNDQPYSLSHYEKGAFSGRYLIDLKSRRRYK